MERTEALRRIQGIHPSLYSVSYVPTLFRASNPPPQENRDALKSTPPIPHVDHPSYTEPWLAESKAKVAVSRGVYILLRQMPKIK
ncbi:hypothetical protein PVAP13_8KG350902 [Panicum virgatum]|uniref:Uncharacterized protein n=1 Tax=Panicum virgatum TaxID=38727 RepID=A0A8T0PSD6_PANVG|nr:hypothetical protein PVAP13_8KG350902 [Panicum virgatum]